MTTLSLIRIPVMGATQVWLRFSPVPRAHEFRSNQWRHEPLTYTQDGWWQTDLSRLPDLTDGAYEYEFVVDRSTGSQTAADPYAEQVTRFCGYRAVFHVRNGQRIRLPFYWEGELSGGPLPNNNEMVIYELPMRWVDAGEDGQSRQVGLGTFDKAIFERLQDGQSIGALGVNCLELLPVQDSPDTLNWGYGTRFFFASDFDMGEPFDLKLFVKHCHQRRIRVILDLVMNHAKKCPLRDLAFDMFFLQDGKEEKDSNGDARPSWGGDIFRYRMPTDGVYHARDFHYGVAEFLIREFHIDGFRLDEFKGIDNYDFIQDFTDHCHAVQQAAFPDRPFLVIAEDSWRRAQITKDRHRGRRVVDSMWDFDFRDEVRRLVGNTLLTTWGEPSRSTRVCRMLTVENESLFQGNEDEKERKLFLDLARRVTYCTSHDVERDDEQRLVTYFLDKLALNDPIGHRELDHAPLAFEQVHSTFALMLTAAGIPMFLAGEEFGDLHDTDRRDWRHKMSDPVDWYREQQPAHADVLRRIRELIRLRTQHRELMWNNLAFFGFSGGTHQGFHPTFDENDGERLFAYCRTHDRPVGSQGQVIVVANCSKRHYPNVLLNWPWGYQLSLREHGSIHQPYPFVRMGRADLELKSFQTRVFSI